MIISKTVKMKLDNDDNNGTNAQSDKGSYTDMSTSFINDNHFAKINTDRTNSFINTN